MSSPKERGIIFSGLLVMAIIEGRKTQTRRVIKPQPLSMGEAEDGGERNDLVLMNGEVRKLHESRSRNKRATGMITARPYRCPYSSIGDRLYVRETWVPKNWTDAECVRAGCPDAATHPTETYLGTPTRAIYRASYTEPQDAGPWKPSIFQPKWASRIMLEITDVRVQRLQDISGVDAVAEGVSTEAEYELMHYGGYKRAKAEFRALWDKINGAKHPWSANDWVWALTFKRV